MYNLASHTQSQAPTWHSSRYSSCIDYIWASHTIICYLTSYYTDELIAAHSVTITYLFPHVNSLIQLLVKENQLLELKKESLITKL